MMLGTPARAATGLRNVRSGQVSKVNTDCSFTFPMPSRTLTARAATEVGKVRSGQQGKNGLSSHLSNALQDSDGDEVWNAGSGSHRGQQGQESRAQTPEPEQPLASHPLCQHPPRKLRHDVPVEEGTQDGALSLLVPVKLSLKMDEIGE